jgi:hypothetical protein
LVETQVSVQSFVTRKAPLLLSSFPYSEITNLCLHQNVRSLAEANARPFRAYYQNFHQDRGDCVAAAFGVSGVGSV